MHEKIFSIKNETQKFIKHLLKFSKYEASTISSLQFKLIKNQKVKSYILCNICHNRSYGNCVNILLSESFEIMCQLVSSIEKKHRFKIANLFDYRTLRPSPIKFKIQCFETPQPMQSYYKLKYSLLCKQNVCNACNIFFLRCTNILTSIIIFLNFYSKEKYFLSGNLCK